MMVSTLRAMWARLVGGPDSREHRELNASSAAAVEYKGCRIRPTPYPANGQFQTAGVVEKDFPEGAKEHRFVRAETHPTEDGAAAFAITKGKQIIDEMGDRIFDAG